MLKIHKIETNSFTQSDVRKVNDILKSGSNDLQVGIANSRLAEKIQSEVSKGRINSAWKITSKD